MNKKVIAGLGVVGGAIALLIGGQAVASHKAAQEVDKAIAGVAPFVDIDYKKVNSSLLGRSTRVKDIVITPVGSSEKYTVDEIVVYQYKEKDNIPTAVNMAVKGMALDPEAMGESAASLKEFGYEGPLLVDLTTEYQYQAEEKDIRLKHFKIGSKDMGDMDVSLHLSNISLDPTTMASMPFSLFGAVFHEAKIVYDDDSLAKRMFEASAKAQGKSIEDFKKEAIASLDSDLANGEAGLTKELATELKDFINNPDGFTVSVSPAKPVAFSELMTTGGDTQKVIELLNIKFES
jgi:hypothetical protein